MGDLKRYRHGARNGVMTPDPDGPFVRYEEAAAALAQQPEAQAGGVKPIERDEQLDRTYIPLPGGWEVQTKGKGSTFRICDPNGDRLAIPDSPYLHETLERMAREVHAACTAPPAKVPEGMETLRHIAAIAHDGFLGGLTVEQAMVCIRRLSLAAWDGSGSTKQRTARVTAAMLAAATAPKEGV